MSNQRSAHFKRDWREDRKIISKIKYFYDRRFASTIFRVDTRCMRKQPRLQRLKREELVTVTGAIYGKYRSPAEQICRLQHLCEGCDRNFESGMVSNAFFEKYISKRWYGNTSRKSDEKTWNAFDGAARNFLSKHNIREKNLYVAAQLCIDSRTYEQRCRQSDETGNPLLGFEAGFSSGRYSTYDIIWLNTVMRCREYIFL